MPAKSKKQQRFFGLVKSIQEGKAHGSSKAEEAAKTMSKKDVTDFASTSQRGLPEKKSNADQMKFLLGLAAVSALGGAGLGAISGGTKELRDMSTMGESRRRKYRRRAAIPLSRRLSDEDLAEELGVELPPSDSSEMRPEDRPYSDLLPEEQADMSNENALKQSSLLDWLGGQVSDFTSENVVKPTAYGAAVPIAAIAPGAAAFLLTQRLFDRRRSKQIDEEVEKAKREFEEALNEPTSKLSADLTQLAQDFTKSAQTGFAPNLPQAQNDGLGLFGNLSYYALGLPAGVGALIGWKMMQDRMENDPERRKLKELNALLRRETAAKVLEGGIDLEEEGGKVKFKL